MTERRLQSSGDEKLEAYDPFLLLHRDEFERKLLGQSLKQCSHNCEANFKSHAQWCVCQRRTKQLVRGHFERQQVFHQRRHKVAIDGQSFSICELRSSPQKIVVRGVARDPDERSRIMAAVVSRVNELQQVRKGQGVEVIDELRFATDDAKPEERK